MNKKKIIKFHQNNFWTINKIVYSSEKSCQSLNKFRTIVEHFGPDFEFSKKPEYLQLFNVYEQYLTINSKQALFYHRNCQMEIPKIHHWDILSSYTQYTLQIEIIYQTIDSQKVNPTLIVSPTFIFLNDEWLNDDEVILRLNSFSFCIMHTLLGKPIYLSKGQHCTPDLLHTACILSRVLYY